MEHHGDAAQQGLHLRGGLQGPAPRHRHALGGRTGRNHILGGHPPAAALAQQLQQAGLLLLTAQVAFIEHEHQALAQAGQGVEYLQFGGAQVPIHHQQQQVGLAGLLPGQEFALHPRRAGLEDAGGIHQPHPPLQTLESQPIALALNRGAHGGANLTNQLLQQGPDQGGLAGRTDPKQHDHQVAPLQFGGHPFAFLLQGFPLHRIPYPLKGLVDARQVLGGCLAAVGWRWPLGPCCRPAPGLPGATQPGPGQLHQQQGPSRKDQQKNRLNYPVGQIPAQLQVEGVDALQHQPHGNQGHQGQAGQEPQAGAGFHARGCINSGPR